MNEFVPGGYISRVHLFASQYLIITLHTYNAERPKHTDTLHGGWGYRLRRSPCLPISPFIVDSEDPWNVDKAF